MLVYGRFTLLQKNRMSYYDYVIPLKAKIGQIYTLPFGKKTLEGLLLDFVSPIEGIKYKAVLNFIGRLEERVLKQILPISYTCGTPLGSLIANY
jgi:hypothetical protein